METDPDQDRYMCNHCFANDFKLMVPENSSDIPRLSQLFTSPNFPPPYKRERLKAQVSADKVKDEHEESTRERIIRKGILDNKSYVLQSRTAYSTPILKHWGIGAVPRQLQQNLHKPPEPIMQHECSICPSSVLAFHHPLLSTNTHGPRALPPDQRYSTNFALSSNLPRLGIIFASMARVLSLETQLGDT
jgi:hypothetical protein